MTAECVTLLGTASIQDYVFRSNRLKENLGASWIVDNALNQWWGRLPNNQILYIGGGNAALLFPAKNPDAIKAVQEWSYDLLSSCPGLRVVAAHEERQQGEKLADTVDRARKALMRAENLAPFGSELGALPVVRDCASTGLAASTWRDEAWLSAEADAKREAAESATEDLRKRYGKALGEKYTFPIELDKLGTKEGSSQIAIVHADGNSISSLIRDRTKDMADDNEFKTTIRAVSDGIRNIAQTALKNTLRDLAKALPMLKNESVVPKEYDGKLKSETYAEFYFPVRPIVDGGDDLTFVCHGKLGLALASRYLKHFEEASAPYWQVFGHAKNAPLTACAGVLIMPQKFPFARGYDLAEALCARAKQARKLQGSKLSWLDFQVLLEGSPGSLDALRAGYSFSDARGDLCLLRRPYCTGDHPSRSWQAFEAAWNNFKDPKKWPRNRAKRLLEALARGREETKGLLTRFKARDIELASEGANGDTFESTVIGWDKGGKEIHAYTTPYFDPLDALDFHIKWPAEEKDIHVPAES